MPSESVKYGMGYGMCEPVNSSNTKDSSSSFSIFNPVFNSNPD
jgi:hypothetical protein